MPKKHQALSLLLAISGCLAADRTDSELKSLFDANDWFRLRDAVGLSADAPPFYRGAVACASPKSERTSNWLFTCVPMRVDGDHVREVEGLRFATSPK